MKRNFAIIAYFLLFFIFSVPVYTQTPWTGDGGKYTRITVSEPLGKGLTAQERQLLPLVQSAIIGVFQKYSAMTVMDQLNLDNVIKRQQLAIVGNFSDTDYVGIGNATNARLVVFGTLTRVAKGYTLQLTVMDVRTGQRKAFCLPKQISLWALENLSAIRTISADLLVQLGVELTSDAIQELNNPDNIARIQAEKALAMGIIAQRQGMIIDALSYYFQATTFDPSLSGAIGRAAAVSAAILSKDFDEDAQSKLQVHDEWRTIITAARIYYEKHLPYELVYDTNIDRGNTSGKTTNLSLNIGLIPADDALKTIGNLRQSLTMAREQDETLKLDLDKIEPRKIAVTIEIVNENDIVLSKASYTFTNPSETNQEKAILRFSNVKTGDITDQLTVRVVSINEIPAQEANKTGYIQISSLAQTRSEVDFNAQN
jgi:hypothetical protein